LGAWLFRGLLAAAIFWFLLEGENFSPEAARLPQLVAGFTLACLLIDAALTWLRQRRARSPADAPERGRAAGSFLESPRFYATVFWLIAFFFLLPWLGYIGSSVLFVFGLSWMLGERRWYVLAACSLVVPFAFWFASEQYLKVVMPAGAWVEALFKVLKGSA